MPAVLDWVRHDFAGKIEAALGFVAYFGIEIGEGQLMFVSIVETLGAAEDAHRQAMMWGENFWNDEVLGMAKEYVGTVTVGRAARAGDEPARREATLKR